MVNYLELENHFKDKESIASNCIISGGVTKPFITIAIPTYKRASLLKETIESTLKQKNVCEYEVIIVDNNPERNDETEILISSYKDRRIYYYKNCENLGLPGNWNRLYTLARGEWVTMIHDDDLLCDNFLEDIFPFLYSDIDILSGTFHPFYKNPVIDTSNLPTQAIYMPFDRLWCGSGLTIAGLTIRKSAIKEIGGFNPNLQNLDCVLIAQMAYYKKAALICKPLAPYRIQCNDSMNEKVFINCINEEYNRQQFILRKNMPKWVAKLIQINTTLSLVESWNKQFRVNFKSPRYPQTPIWIRLISKVAGRIYNMILRMKHPVEYINKCNL